MEQQKGDGIVGIRKTISALGRWALFYSRLSHTATEEEMGFAQILTTSSFTMNATEEGGGTKYKDNPVTTMKTFKLFSRDVPQDMQCIGTKDLASKNSEEDLLIAQQKEQEQLDKSAGQRLASLL